jgi:hypothetical protein
VQHATIFQQTAIRSQQENHRNPSFIIPCYNKFCSEKLKRIVTLIDTILNLKLTLYHIVTLAAVYMHQSDLIRNMVVVYILNLFCNAVIGCCAG